MTFTRATLGLVLLSIGSIAAADLSDSPNGAYVSDPNHSYITFSYSHLGFSVPQVGFDTFTATLTLDSDTVESSSIDVSIDANSINSRVAEFNDHLKGANFFNTAEHPEITFVSTGIEQTGDNSYDVMGDLTIKGVTKPVTLATTINKADMHPMRKVATIGISGQTVVSRSEFGLSRAVPNVGDEVTIVVTSEMLKSD